MRPRFSPLLVFALLTAGSSVIARAQSCVVGTSAYDGSTWVYYEDDKGYMEMWQNPDGTWDAQIHNDEQLIVNIENMDKTESGGADGWSGTVNGSAWNALIKDDEGADTMAHDTTDIWMDKLEATSCEVR